MTAALRVLETGSLVTVQDLGRPGHAASGVSTSGACDRGSFRLANALVGNRSSAAALEVTLGGLVVQAQRPVVVALAGARSPGTEHNAPIRLREGEVLRLGMPAAGLRTYLAVRGGIDVTPVLGSRSTDLLSGLGPKPLAAGDELRVGDEVDGLPKVDVAPVPEVSGDVISVRVGPGPRRDWFTDESWRLLCSQEYSTSPDSNRVGVRLHGTALVRHRVGELASEGILRGAVQVPPSGQPVVFLADHPVTGGYPVLAYVVDDDVDRCAQLRPGQPLRFVPLPD